MVIRPSSITIFIRFQIKKFELYQMPKWQDVHKDFELYQVAKCFNTPKFNVLKALLSKNRF